MDLNLLYIFSAIYRERNLTRASKIVGISPAGASAALRRLRDEFQDSLFIRTAHGVEPTVRANTIAEKLGLALDLVEQARKPERVFDPAKEECVFLIGMSDYSQAIILPALLEKLRQSAPGISLAIRSTGNDSVRQALDDGAFDLIIGNVSTPLGRIRQQQLLMERFSGIVARTHPLAGKALDIRQLNDYPALLTEGHGNDRWWEHPLIRSTGYAPRRIVSIPGFLAVPLMLLDSPLVCVTAHRLCAIFTRSYPLDVVPLPFDDQSILIRQYWHERWHADPTHRWLRQAIYSLCKTL